MLIMSRLISIVLLVIVTFAFTECYNILGLFPYAGKSHFYVFEALMKGLADKGHSVTVLSQFPQKSAHPNYKDFILPRMKEGSNNVIGFDQIPENRLKLYGTLYMLYQFGVRDCQTYLPSKEIKEFIDMNEKFDVIIIESFNTDCFFSIVHQLNAPFILISSSILMPWNFGQIGSPDNPSYIPSHVLDFTNRMTFLQRVENTLVYGLSKIIYKCLMVKFANKIAAETFGANIPKPSDTVKNASLIFTNSHFTISLSKPMVPGIIEIGGIHINDTNRKKLPQNIEKWINDSKDGVIYFSMGSMIKGDTFPEEKRQIFMRVFGRLSQRVLWKWENDTMPGKTDNVMIQKWMPQFDVLCHPNVKAYISHGGLLGTTEAVHCGVPAVVMPQFGDQHTNAKALEASGGGVVLNFNDLTEESVYNTLTTILKPSFQKETKELSERFRDRPLPPLDTAVYWVEYVARHKGARHMRSAAVDMPLYKYLLLDVIGFLLIIFIFILTIIYLTLRGLFRKLFKKNTDVIKKKRN